MLNEVFALEQGLRALDVATTPRHPEIMALGKGDVIRVRLDAAGGIAELELLPRRTRADMWTLREGNHNGFPGVRVTKGLLAIGKAALAEHKTGWTVAKDAAARRAEILRLAGAARLPPDAAAWPKRGHRAHIAAWLSALRSLEGDPDTEAVPATFARFLRALESRTAFFQLLLDALLERVRTADAAWLEPAWQALTESIVLAFDVAREPQFARDAGDERQIGPVSAALGDGSPRRATSAESITGCAFGGSGRLLNRPYPKPTLPGVGQTILFTRNEKIPAMARYGRNGPGAMPIAADLAARLSGAMTKITAPARCGQTWRLLPADRGEKPDLLIAFVASAPEASVADALVEPPEEDSPAAELEEDVAGEAELSAAGAQMLALFDGIAQRAAPHEAARIVILRAVDPGNRKAIYEARPPVRRLHEAAREWVEAMRNVPPTVSWPDFTKKTRVCRRPLPQRPLGIVSLTQRQYVPGERRWVNAPKIPASEAFALFLGEGNRARRARRILSLILQRHGRLLADLSHASARRELRAFDPEAECRRDALRGIAWIGALLWFIGRKREVFMEDAGFKLGQLLAAADEIHIGYCVQVRRGDIPPTLVGNSVFAAAGRHPDRALDMLCLRWKPYHAWATRAGRAKQSGATGGGDTERWEVGRAVKQARQAARLCEDLHPLLAEARRTGRAPDEVFRAELLLGYVAGLRPEPKTNPSTRNEQELTA